MYRYIQLKECMNDSSTGDYEDMNKKQLLCVVNNLEKVRDTCVYVIAKEKSTTWITNFTLHYSYRIQLMGSSSIKVKSCNFIFNTMVNFISIEMTIRHFTFMYMYYAGSNKRQILYFIFILFPEIRENEEISGRQRFPTVI